MLAMFHWYLVWFLTTWQACRTNTFNTKWNFRIFCCICILSPVVTCKCGLHLGSLIQTSVNEIAGCSWRDLASYVLVWKSSSKLGRRGWIVGDGTLIKSIDKVGGSAGNRWGPMPAFNVYWDDFDGQIGYSQMNESASDQRRQNLE